MGGIARKKATPPIAGRGLPVRFAAFVAERFPFALPAVLARIGPALDAWPGDAAALDRLASEAERTLAAIEIPAPDGIESTPGVAVATRIDLARRELADAVSGFLRREAIAASFTRDERREMLRGMLLTRATDNELKNLFLGGLLRHGKGSFQGKGFRSLGQEAIYAAPLRLRRGPAFRDADGGWRGDVIAPLIRDLGAALAMRPEPESVYRALNAQAGKAGPPMDGRDFHIGDMDWGVLPATAPLAISTATAAGVALAFGLRGEDRVVVSFIGEGGSSLGEWHEAINVCAARRLPALFCVENNQTALSTPVSEQSAVRVFADKAAGYGIPGITLDGTDPEAIAAAFAWGAERARAGHGPTLIELVSMRMCGHAHHDDMLYLGKEPATSWGYPETTEQGYADREAFARWARRDPIARYAEKLEAAGDVEAGEVERWKREIETTIEEQTARLVAAEWPAASSAGAHVVAGEPPRRHVEPLDPVERERARSARPALPALEPGLPFDPNGRTFLEAVMRGVGDALRADPRVFVYGQDVGGRYGNAFLMLRPLLADFGDRILNAPLAEGGILGACVGAALAGMRPIAEIQFNDFVATGFNQLVNNAAKIRYRWGGAVPMVVRMPWGGLRRAGPYHSQHTEPWFYRTPGLKIVVPSTPADARALLASAVADPDPVLYYEHIALYRDPKVKQLLDDEPPAPLPVGRAALRRAGSDLAIVSYGAFVHRAMEVAGRLAAAGIESSVLDLRWLAPLDREALLAVARHAGKVLILHEDARTGGIGESLAAIVQEQAFEDLDAPVRIVGALDTPVPYAPPLEDEYLPSLERIERAARLLAAY
jgi:2-oxoisovalerate dehydrogenase E1 component